jgi:glycosyltransferase involved in cell wall biosynthesis
MTKPGITLWLLFSLYPPHTGGAATYADLLVKFFGKDDAVRRVVVLTEGDGVKRVRRDGKSLILRFMARRDSLARKSMVRYVASYFAVQASMTLFVLAARVSGRGNIVHLHNRLSSRWLRLWILLLRVPAVCDVRDQLFVPGRLAGFPAIIGASRQIVATAAQAVEPARLHYIPVPVDLARTRALATQAAANLGDYFLFVGTMTESKGAGELIEAYLRLRRVRGDLPRLVMCGDYRLARDPPREEQGVDILGAVPWERVPALIARAKLLVLPSRVEGMPRVLLEAIALGTPILCGPDIAEIMDCVPQCVLPSLTVDGIAAALDGPVERYRAGAYPIERHDIPACFASTLQIYRSLTAM